MSQLKEIMNVRFYCTEYYLLSDTKTTRNLKLLQRKSVLIDLWARNFVHANTSLRARWAHGGHRARNLSSPANKMKEKSK